MMKNPLILVMIALIYGAIAVLCMMWPERVRAYALRRSERPRNRRYACAVWLVESPHYVLYVQISGAISASVALAITLFLLDRLKHPS